MQESSRENSSIESLARYCVADLQRDRARAGASIKRQPRCEDNLRPGNRTIIDGYCRWDLARRQGRTTATCIEYDLSEERALHWLLYRRRRREGLNHFRRILLALDLELWFREQARVNQSTGGQIKGSSKLTEAERGDVRSEIAAAAAGEMGTPAAGCARGKVGRNDPCPCGSGKKYKKCVQRSGRCCSITTGLNRSRRLGPAAHPRLIDLTRLALPFDYFRNL